jgi:hypothetical protein
MHAHFGRLMKEFQESVKREPLSRPAHRSPLC